MVWRFTPNFTILSARFGGVRPLVEALGKPGGKIKPLMGNQEEGTLA